ncbi:hypothetical protein FSP39_007773 [Pinctada imbricata]|uniref:Uncharacterized protein n=1 Tax=Pinctada imbricata TaxID=66713 RepID=A0AA88XVV2_PINIB|nr:hypothetical protein FSP39_007773 [Pinctada imbricata]
MFRQEMLLLGRELVEFRNMCNQEISKYRKHLQHQKDLIAKEEDSEQTDTNDSNGNNEKTSVEKYWQTKLDSLQSDMTFLEKKQTQLDKEQQLLDKEEELSERQREVEKYEQEIIEIERMLDRRQERCAKRETDLMALEEDIQKYKVDLEDSKDKLEKQDEETSSERAKRNWEVLRKSLQDKETVLESTVKKYRMELATSTSNITAKNIMIEKLDEQVKRLYTEVDEKDRKIKQLEGRLVLTIQSVQRQESTSKSRPSRPKLTPQSSSDSVSDSSPTHKLKGRKLGTSLKLGGKYDSLKRSDSIKRLTPEYANGGRLEQGETRVVRHPFRQSIDCGDNRNFQGLRSPLPMSDNDVTSSSCAVM